MIEIKTTISDLIYQTQKMCNPVYGIDISKLSKIDFFDMDGNDIHSLYKYVKEINSYSKLPLNQIRNYNVTFDLSQAYFNPTLRPFVRKYVLDMLLFDFESSNFQELYHFCNILFDILFYFEIRPCFQTSLLGYLYLVAMNLLPYDEIWFHNFYLIDFSESPDTVDAIKHFRLDVENGNVRFIFKDYETSLMETFRILIEKKEFIKWLEQKYSPNKIQRINNVISLILSNM